MAKNAHQNRKSNIAIVTSIIAVIVTLLLGVGGGYFKAVIIFGTLDGQLRGAKMRINLRCSMVQEDITKLKKHIDKVERKFDKVEKKFDAVERKFNTVEKKIFVNEKRIRTLEEYFAKIAGDNHV